MLRYGKAQILGHTTYTEWLMATRMEKDPKRVITFLKDLLTTVGPAKDLIVEQWRQMKKEDLETIEQPDDGSFYVWDRFYYTKRMMESTFAFDSDTVKEHFPLEHTVSCMLGIFGHLFGLRFVNTDGIAHPCPQTDIEERATVWHEDVLLFAVWDHAGRDQEDADFLGYLYMDLYPRPGKIPGFADLPIHPVCTHRGIEQVYRNY
jgi:metallopeptidase MepB